jgi:hypothetical protein
LVSKRKHNKEKRYSAEREEAVAHPPANIVFNIPNPLPVRQEPSADDKQRYANEKTSRDEQLRTAQRLNKITAGGVALALISLLFVWFSYQQSRQTLELDQRAWLEYAKTPDAPNSQRRTIQFQAGQPFSVQVLFKNTGKTPARNLVATVFLDTFGASEAVPLDHVGKSYTHETITAGILTPNDEFGPILVVRHGADHSVTLVTSEQVGALASGKFYFAIYGVISYDDIFGVHHWTNFCDWNGVGAGPFNTYQCTEYNDVDSD